MCVIGGNGGGPGGAAEVPDCVVVPVGGGGLSAGLVVARDRLAPGCEIIGAEPLLANDAARSLRSGRLERNEAEGETLCDGARTLSLGARNFAILRRGLAGIVEVEEAYIHCGRALVRSRMWDPESQALADDVNSIGQFIVNQFGLEIEAKLIDDGMEDVYRRLY